jgi:hypothetical protein
VGVEGRHAVLAAAAELGFIRRGGGAEAVEQGLLGVGEAGREGEEVGHRVAFRKFAQALGPPGEDVGRGQPVGAGVGGTLGGDLFGAEEGGHVCWVSCGGGVSGGRIRPRGAYLPVICLYQARWCCLAQARVTVP